MGGWGIECGVMSFPNIDLSPTLLGRGQPPPTELQKALLQIRSLMSLRPPRDARKPALMVMEAGVPPRWEQLRSPACTLGRDPASDICVSSAQISRLHMVFSWGYGLWQVEDVGSSNGIFFRDERLHRRSLCSGDILRAGDVYLLFVDAATLSP